MSWFDNDLKKISGIAVLIAILGVLFASSFFVFHQKDVQADIDTMDQEQLLYNEEFSTVVRVNARDNLIGVYKDGKALNHFPQYVQYDGHRVKTTLSHLHEYGIDLSDNILTYLEFVGLGDNTTVLIYKVH